VTVAKRRRGVPAMIDKKIEFRSFTDGNEEWGTLVGALHKPTVADSMWQGMLLASNDAMRAIQTELILMF